MEVEDEVAQARSALGAACGEILAIRFDAHDADSIASAVRMMESLIDRQIAALPRNRHIVDLANDLKDGLRQAIWDESGITRQ